MYTVRLYLALATGTHLIFQTSTNFQMSVEEAENHLSSITFLKSRGPSTKLSQGDAADSRQSSCTDGEGDVWIEINTDRCYTSDVETTKIGNRCNDDENNHRSS